MTSLDIARLRLAAQRITAPAGTTPQDVVAALGAMQAQDYRSALWAVGLRLPGASAAGVEAALAGAAIVRTWALRGTLHFLAAADVRWILGLLAPRVIAGGAYRLRQLEIDERVLGQSRDVLTQALAGAGLLARSELMKVLEAAGISTGGQRGTFILWHLSLEGLLCQGTGMGRQGTLALLDERVPKAEAMDREEALAALALRYFSGHGPATLRDFTWWSGLTASEARAGTELAKSRLASQTVGEATYWMAAAGAVTPPPAPAVCLLPGFDEFILGYADRQLTVDAAAVRLIIPPGGGLFLPAVMVDGRVVGTWRLGGKTRAAAVDLFAPLTAAASRALNKALAEYDAFLTGPAALAEPAAPAESASPHGAGLGGDGT